MRRTTMLLVPTAIFTLAVCGCHNHQAQVTDLQGQYDQLAKQYQQDCSGELLNVPPKVSPKCKDEEAKMNDAWKRLQAERAKK